MSILPRRLALFRSRANTDELEERVSALQSALAQCRSVASRCRTYGRELLALTAAVSLVVGFTLGVYREPIVESFRVALVPLGVATDGLNTDAASTAYQKGNYTTALKIAQPLAEGGDPRAQSLVGLIYYRGRDVRQDDAEAMRWFNLAAERGDAPAQFNLGVMFDEGRGVPQDPAAAERWYRRAAEQGHAQAQYNLGLSLAGRDDNVNAHMWFNLAAARFPQADVRARSAATRNRDVVAAKMTPEQIAEAQKLATDWRQK
jgi:hypothetical protein